MILGIESSCDESALALFDPGRGMRGEWVRSQIALHQPFGGIVPDLASREHLESFPAMLGSIGASLTECRPELVAVTRGPGLAACLALGIAAGRALAAAWGVPIVGVNHLRGHLYSPFIPLHAEDPGAFRQRFAERLPHLGLLVSGGNTLLFSLEGEGDVTVLARTVDDAAGEALDKGAKLLGMPYPGGPLIEAAARAGNPHAIDFPRAFPRAGDWRFSFSGLKTSLRYLLERLSDEELAARCPDICASYQEAVVDALTRKVQQALQERAYRSLGLSGGVANNQRLRAALGEVADHAKLPLYLAEPRHTGDNAAMIAFAAWVGPRPGEGRLDIAPNLELTDR